MDCKETTCSLLDFGWHNDTEYIAYGLEILFFSRIIGKPPKFDYVRIYVNS